MYTCIRTGRVTLDAILACELGGLGGIDGDNLDGVGISECLSGDLVLGSQTLLHTIVLTYRKIFKTFTHFELSFRNINTFLDINSALPCNGRTTARRTPQACSCSHRAL